MAKRTLNQLDVAGKRVLVRVDFNVPIDQGIEGIALYDQRLRATLPTIRYLIDQGSKVVLCSHLGRPKGEVVEGLRLAPVGDRLAMLLERQVKSLPEITGPAVEQAISEMSAGDVVLLENLRFNPGEEKNDGAFACELSDNVDCFVNDAFAVCHRAHASTDGITKFLPSAMGLLVQKEVESMGKALESPEKPLAALMGGAKVSDKILLLDNLLEKLDHLFIGGGMCVTFLNALGYSTGASRIEEDRLEFAKEIMARAEAGNVKLHLPENVVIANEFAADPAETDVMHVGDVPDGWYIMDIAPNSAEDFAKALTTCKTIIWNGPMGVFEMPKFSHGTRTVANAIAGITGVTSVVGGGSTAEAIEELGLMDKMTHVSTGGGASLEFLEGKELPGIAALPDA
ncbi:MAG TPA: phosphoglycerate kinase [Dehalococcoidia bacterium]|nr:phosphoglycerate kinase [Chloroflexota bacterium]MQF96176.1 phosphoglycerate kinase [SAR202 cluster bacterium]HAA95690.1 phosphoglycerate kinase [Dehalococcoidia bacterium]HCL26698.1 phosphoglycerate kinase [Dehalococcoidia bacterium]|tara:strand:- start:7260 stop:8456 length:1197 start_codon:yes stop_codon:yes gene_type:complete